MLFRSLRGKKGVSLQDDEAVVYVSYQDALDFCHWLSEKEGKTYRLPTEAEWDMPVAPAHFLIIIPDAHCPHRF